MYNLSPSLCRLPEILPVSPLRRSGVLVLLAVVVVVLVAILLLALVGDAGGPDGAQGDRDHHGQVEHGVVSSFSSSAAAAKKPEPRSSPSAWKQNKTRTNFVQ